LNPGLVSTLGVLVGGVSFGVAGFAFALFATVSLALSSPPQVVVGGPAARGHARAAATL
jgi:hypothetical protein